MTNKKTTVYVPDNAKINVENIKMDAPPVKYENRKKIIDRDVVKRKVEKR